MSKLLDKLIDEINFIKKHDGVKKFYFEEIDGKLYYAKPSKYRNYKLKYRIKDAIRVLCGKSFAVHYKSDENKQLPLV